MSHEKDEAGITDSVEAEADLPKPKILSLDGE
jgi:hypothetical protein